MKMVITTFVLVCIQSGIFVTEARDAYFASYKGTSEVQKFEKLLDSVGSNAAPVLLCYKGAAEMLKAKNTANPISKYSFFKRGKALIELGLNRDITSVESHFIRFIVQRNLPGFSRL